MSAKRPNVLLIVADDLGFSDIGCYGSEIKTPHIDALAAEGLRMLNFHSAQACSPTRAMLMTGTDAHLGGLGCLIEHKSSEQGQKRWGGKAGYEGYLNKDVAPISEILQDNGYFTALGGKWHLGLRPDHGPAARGFDKSFTLLPGCANHYGWEPQLADGYSGMRLGGRPLHAENGKYAPIPANKNPEDESGFYSSDYYTDKLVQYLEERSEEEKEKPFFAYHAFSAPHWPIQSPKSIREKYKGMYDDGPAALRLKRLQNLRSMGVISEDVIPHEVVAPNVPEFETLNDYQKACSARCMEAYAGMVESMDSNIGKVVAHLKKTGEYDNTFIVFMSDNGAEGAAYEAYPLFGNKIMEAIGKYYDNSLDNIGNWNSYTWIGPRWAQASTAPSRLHKSFPSEGGILVPCVIKAPAFLPEFQKGEMSRAFTTCMDVVPTILEMAGIDVPKAQGGKKALHRGREVHPVRGTSLLPWFGRKQATGGKDGETLDPAAVVHSVTEVVGWEMLARAALRQGRWKIVHLPKEWGGAGVGDEGWELFDVEADPGETKDLASVHPEKVEELLRHWQEYVQEMGIVWGPDALQPGLSKEQAPHLHDSDMEQQRSWMQLPAGGVPVDMNVRGDAPPPIRQP